MTDLTYLVSAPPQNKDILKFHSMLLNKYWSDCPYETAAVINDEPMQHNATQYNATQYNTIQYNTIQLYFPAGKEITSTDFAMHWKK